MTISGTLALLQHSITHQNIYRRMLTFIMTPTANIMDASAEPP